MGWLLFFLGFLNSPPPPSPLLYKVRIHVHWRRELQLVVYDLEELRRCWNSARLQLGPDWNVVEVDLEGAR